MRQILIVTAAVGIAVVVALFGTSAMNAHLPQMAQPAATAGSLDITQMTKDAKVLPVEQFDAI